jgi:DNA-binding transcriptional LysR family regulator
MHVEYLRNFIKLVKYKSFTALAQDLPISQSTLSNQISQLEKDFGVTLIERTTKKFEVTEAGQVVLQYAVRMVDALDQCVKDVEKYKKIKEKEEIVISASTIPGSHVLPRFIADFRTTHSNVSFKVLINNSRTSIENLRKDLADFAGVGSFLDYDQQLFEVIGIGEDEFYFICSPNHPILRMGKYEVSFSDLINYPFIWREKGSGMRDTFEKQFPDYLKLKIELEVNDNDSIISTVSDSNYISIMSEFMAKKAEKAGLIKILKLKQYSQIAKRSLHFLKRRNVELTSLKQEFWDELKRKTKNL